MFKLTGLQLCGRIDGIADMFRCPFVKHHSKHNLVIWSRTMAISTVIIRTVRYKVRRIYVRVHTALSMSNTKHEISSNKTRETKSFFLVFLRCVYIFQKYLYLHLASCFWVGMDHHQVIKPSAATNVSLGWRMQRHAQRRRLPSKPQLVLNILVFCSKEWHKSHTLICPWIKPLYGPSIRDAPFWRENNPEGSTWQECCQSAG